MQCFISRARRGAFVIATFAGLFAASNASADIIGFGTGANWTLNGYDQDNFGNITNTNDPATISSGVLHITNQTQAQARSAFFNTPQSLAAFTASLRFRI